MVALQGLQVGAPYDFVFIDADKGRYDQYGRWARRHLRPGRLPLADNVYLFGRLLEPDDPEAEAVLHFHRETAHAFETACVPTPDGLLIGTQTRIDVKEVRPALTRFALDPTAPSIRWIVLALIVFAGCGESAGHVPGPIRGLRLGMVPAQARERLVVDRPGSFETLAIGEDHALRWTPDDPEGAELLSAQMEFHSGLLVALRLELDPGAADAEGEALIVSPGSIVTRERGPSRAAVTWLARNCPTHADEVSRMLRDRS